MKIHSFETHIIETLKEEYSYYQRYKDLYISSQHSRLAYFCAVKRIEEQYLSLTGKCINDNIMQGA